MRLLSVIGVCLAVAVGVVALGRWERDRAIRTENSGMRSVLADVGPLDRAVATGYRIASPFCLAYTDGKNRFAYQLCWDGSGRLVESVDRTAGKPKYSSLVWDPRAASDRIPVPELVHLFKVASTPSGH